MTMLCKDSTNHDEHDITSLIKHASCTHLFVNLLETTFSFSVNRFHLCALATITPKLGARLFNRWNLFSLYAHISYCVHQCCAQSLELVSVF